MTRFRLLEENAGRLRTKMGAAFVGQRAVFRGHDLHADLKDMDWLELYVFGLTAKRFTQNQRTLLHALWVYTSYPDARIWNNRVVGLAGSARSTGALGLAAALAVSEAKVYGLNPCIRAFDFFSSAMQKLASGCSLTDIIEQEIQVNKGIGGYGRPLTAHDERIEPIVALARQLNLAEGRHLKLAFDTDDVLRLSGRARLKINYAAVLAAFSLDLGFTREQYYLFIFPLFLGGMPPCFIEAAKNPEGTLFPLACADVLYEGRPKRSWKDKKSGNRI